MNPPAPDLRAAWPPVSLRRVVPGRGATPEVFDERLFAIVLRQSRSC